MNQVKARDVGHERLQAVLITLTYEGALPSAQQGSANQAKARLRRHFHDQLTTLWARNPPSADESVQTVEVGEHQFRYLVVDERHGIGIHLDLLLLVRNRTLRQGDLDNRIKTLTDALAVPPNQQQADLTDAPSNGPTVCLMKDDMQVHGLNVTRREWLTPATGNNYNDVHVVATARTFAVGPISWAGMGWIG